VKLAHVFDTAWHQLTVRQPAPPYLLLALTAVFALVMVFQRRLWRLSRNAVTIAHEGGHALVAVLCGRRLQSIRLHSDTSGLTITKGKPTGFGAVMTLMAGYIAPSLIGFAGAALLARHHIRLTLWVAVGLLVVMLFVIRNLYGALAVLITGGAVFAVSWFASAQVQAAFAYAGVWFLLLGGVRPVFELARQRRQGKARDSDVDQLATMTRIPGGLWLCLYLLVSVGALVLGVASLVPLRPGM
jgi:hypothetical protein